MVFIDNIENILSVEDSEDMKPLMDRIRKLAKELGIPIISEDTFIEQFGGR